MALAVVVAVAVSLLTYCFSRRYCLFATDNYCNFAYSALACLRMGMSGSAFFHSVKKS